MKTIINHIWRVLTASIALYIIWIISMTIAGIFVVSGLETPDAPESLMAALLFIVCLVHVIVLYLLILHAHWRGLKLIILIFLLLFTVQYFLSVIEAIWFNDSLEMPSSGHAFLLLSGFFTSLLFSPLIVWIAGGTKGRPALYVDTIDWREIFSGGFLLKMIVLAVLVYPMIYNLAGYYIAWQFDAVRLFYTDSLNIRPFYVILAENIRSGLYFFQIPRGIIWILLALVAYNAMYGGALKKGIIIGLIFATLMNAQHLLPNPYFPREVSFAHFIETFLSNFLWGLSITIVLGWHQERSHTVRA